MYNLNIKFFCLILIIILFSSVSLPSVAGELFLSEFGSNGDGDSQFRWPTGIAFDSFDNFYITDQWNHRVQKFNSAGVFQGWIGKCTSGANCDIVNQHSNGFLCTAATCSGQDSGTGDGQLDLPWGIAIDSSDNIYIAEQNSHRVQKFNSAGISQGWIGKCTSGANCDTVNQHNNGFLCTAATCSGQGSGTGDGQLDTPLGIAIDSSDNIWVADSHNNRVQKFNSAGISQGWIGDCTSGANCDTVNQRNDRFLLCTAATCSGHSFGSANGQFIGPTAIAISPPTMWYDKMFFVSDVDERFQMFSSIGGFVKSIGTDCTLSTGVGCIDPDGAGPLNLGDGQFNYSPMGMTVDKFGIIYVADSFNNRIQKFSPNGDVATHFIGPTFLSQFISTGSAHGPFIAPSAVAADRFGNIYVATDGFKIQKFAPLMTLPATMHGGVEFATSSGGFSTFETVNENTLPSAGRPNISFPYGFYNWEIDDLPRGQTVTITLTYPSNVPVGAQYWKVIGNTWTDVTSLLGSDDGDNVLTLTITDGGLGDADGVINGKIKDPGGVGLFSSLPSTTTSETSLEQMYAIFIAMTVIVIASGIGVWTIMRRRK